MSPFMSPFIILCACILFSFFWIYILVVTILHNFVLESSYNDAYYSLIFFVILSILLSGLYCRLFYLLNN